MVQILPPKFNIGSQIGESLGQGLQTGMQQGLQRGKLQQALGKVSELGKPNAEGKQASPFELASALMSATAGIPGAERYVGQLFPLLLAQLQNKEFAGIPPAGGAPSIIPGGEIGAQQPATPSANGMQGAASQSYDKIVQKRSSLPLPIPEADYDPFAGMEEGITLGGGPIPRTHSEEQYSQVAQTYRAKGLDPSIAVEQMQLEDKIARERQQDVLRGVETESQVQTLRNAAQQRFRSALEKTMPGADAQTIALGERFKNLPEIRSIPNVNQQADAVKKKIDLYDAAKNNFKKSAVRRDYDPQEHKRKLDQLATYGKVMVDAGERAEGERILAEGDFGPVEIESILNPLSKTIQQGIKNLPKLEDIQTKINVLPDSPKFEQQVQIAMKNRQKDIGKYSDYIRKNFEKGQYDPLNRIKPGTSLLQLRDEAMQRGMTFQEFESVINNLISSKEIQLDDYQKKDLPLLSEHPIRSFGIGEILWRLNPWYIPRK